MTVRLRQAGFEAYLAGGCVRDVLLGRAPKDYDVATSATPDQVQALFPRTVAVGAAFGVVRVLVPGPEGDVAVEVATFRTEGPYEDGRRPSSVRFSDARSDVLRRDFTINGLLMDPETGEVLDYVGGLEDLRAGTVRAIGDPRQRFEEDRLRMLRAVRLSAELAFRIHPDTLEAIREQAPLIRSVSAERVYEELSRLLVSPGRGAGLRLLEESGLLRELLPEVAAMRGVPQPEEYHPEGDVFEHTVRVLEALREPTVTLAWGALLHDVGKPLTYEVRERIRFPRHDEVGAQVADQVMRRLRASNEQVERVTALVRGHMRVKDFPQMREAKRRRLAGSSEFPELVELLRADSVASHGDLTVYEWIQAWLRERASEPLRPARLVTGHDLIALGLRPGPVFRDILDAVYNAQLEGQVKTRQQALALAAREVQRRAAGGEAPAGVEPHG
ncbi:MAG: CCA tRNA nucleotidyltransferase [Armatimonadota bacterium]|nr:CCA tRNA nucleotidyltransferase [Armatimonadota bacterium]